MVQDIAPHHLDNSYHDQTPSGQDILFVTDGERMLARLSEDGRLSFPRFRDFAVGPQVSRYLFQLDGESWFAALDYQQVECPGYTWLHTGKLRGANPAEYAFAGVTAMQLVRWYRANIYCGCCGDKLCPDGRERMLRCPSCGNMVYPKISPCVIVGITDGDKILLTKYARNRYTHYALVAGFCEIGESLEETVRREVREEGGLEVENIRYWGSQPWSFSDTLLAGFFCDVKGDPTPHLVDGELREATWFAREEIPVHDDGVSLTRALIAAFQQGKIHS